MKAKRIYFILNIIVIISIAMTFAYVIAVGEKYTVNLNIIGLDKVPEVTCTDSDLMIGNVYLEDDNLFAELTAKRKGKYEVSFRIMNEDPDRLEVLRDASFYVTATGTIFETSYNNVNFTGFRIVIAETLCCVVLVLVIMCISYFRCKKLAKFSYSMIAYGGISLFTAVMLAFVVYKMLNNAVNSFSDFVRFVSISGEYCILALTPVMLIMALATSISNISLMRHEGYRPVNALGLIASVFWLLGTFFVFNYSWYAMLGNKNSELAGDIRTIIIYTLCYFESMIISTSISAWLAARFRPPLNKDYIIILGCAIRNDGSLTPLLKGRVDSALRFENQQYEKTGKHAVFVPSGGQGSDEVISEGEAMKRYLISQGVPEERILPECKSVNTFENFKLSYEVIKKNDDKPMEKGIGFATTNYHIFRGYILSAKNGFRAEGISARTKWYFFPNAFLREFVGMLFDQKLRHILFIVLVTLFFLAI